MKLLHIIHNSTIQIYHNYSVHFRHISGTLKSKQNLSSQKTEETPETSHAPVNVCQKTEKKHQRNLVRSVLQRQLQQKKKVYQNQERDQKTNKIEKSRNFGMTSNMTHYLRTSPPPFKLNGRSLSHDMWSCVLSAFQA